MLILNMIDSHDQTSIIEVMMTYQYLSQDQILQHRTRSTATSSSTQIGRHKNKEKVLTKDLAITRIHIEATWAGQRALREISYSTCTILSHIPQAPSLAFCATS